MPFNTRRKNEMEMDRLYEVLLEGMEENAGVYEKRKIVNSILPVDKYTLQHWFLSDDELSEEIRLNSLLIFLDENTKYFNFVEDTTNQTTIKSILELIPRYCPNIQTVNFRSLVIKYENLENFKRFLKQMTGMKFLRVSLFNSNCVINQLLLKEDFDLHDQDVQNGLLKIERIREFHLEAPACAKLLKLLPNLISFGYGPGLSQLVNSDIEDDDELIKKLSNICIINDKETNLSTLEHFIRFCPKVTEIYLNNPNAHVIENLSKFPLLIEILLDCENIDQIIELIELLDNIGTRIKFLNIDTPNNFPLDREIIICIHKLCPELIILEIDGGLFRFD